MSQENLGTTGNGYYILAWTDGLSLAEKPLQGAYAHGPDQEYTDCYYNAYGDYVKNLIDHGIVTGHVVPCNEAAASVSILDDCFEGLAFGPLGWTIVLVGAVSAGKRFFGRR